MIGRARPAWDGRDMDFWNPGNMAVAAEISSPIILGDGREAPKYGNISGKEASCKWYTKYGECCSYVVSRNDMGFLRRERVSPERLMPQRVRGRFSRIYRTEGSLAGDQLLMGLEHHAGNVVGKAESASSSAEQLAKVAATRPGGGSAEARVGALISNLEASLCMTITRTRST